MKRVGQAMGGLALLTLLWLYLSHLFHLQGGRVPSAGIGPWSDPYFINFVLEYWLHAIRTWSDPASPPIFHPVTLTLGYSHSLILFAPLYIGARTVLDPFGAETLTVLVVFGAGLLSLWVLLWRYLGAGVIAATALTILVATSPNIVNTGTEMWVQRTSSYLVPPLLCLGAYALRTTSRRRRLVVSALFGFGLVSLFTHEIYTGLLFFLVIAALGLGTLAAHRWTFVRHLWRTAIRPVTGTRRRPPSRGWLVLALFLLLLAVLIAAHPIERTMIGSWRLSATDPMRPLRLAALAGGWFVIRLLHWRGVRRAGRAVRRAARAMGLAATLALTDQAEVRSAARERARSWGRGSVLGALAGALVFLWIYGPVMLEHRGFSSEQIRGNLIAIDPANWHDLSAAGRAIFAYDSVRPFAILGMAIALVWLPIFRAPLYAKRLALVSAALSVFVAVVALRLGSFSVWGGIAGLVPGMSVIRDPKRIIYLYELVVPCVIGLLAGWVRVRRILFLAVITSGSLALLAADWHTRSFGFARTPEVFDHWVNRPIAVDSSCRSFFVTGIPEPYLSRSDHLGALFATDAAFIALRTGIPTLNGYSGWTPDGWDLSSPHDARYMTAVREWIARHRLTGVCALDLGARTMTPFE